MSFNERIFSILTESSKSCKSKVCKDECGEACETFADTIGNGHNFSDTIIPASIKMNEEKLPIEKSESCKKEGCCKESYFIDSRILDIYMEDNDIQDAGEAVERICEYYDIPLSDMCVVVESDHECQDLIDFAKDSSNYVSLGLLRKCNNRITALVNKGIQVAKRG